MFPGPFLSKLIMSHNQQKKVVKYVAAGAFGNIIFNALLIPIYGIVGAAITTIATYSLYYGFAWRQMKKITELKALPYLKKITAAAVIMGIFTFIFNKFGLNVILNIISSTAIYFGMLYLLKEKILGEFALIFKKLKTPK